MSNGLKKSSKRKQNLYNKFLKTRTVLDKDNYQNYKNLFQKIIKKAKSNFYSNLLNKHRSDPKKTWEIIIEVRGRKNLSAGCLPKVIKKGQTLIQNERKICIELNNFFTQVGPNLAAKITDSTTDFKTFLGDPTETILHDTELTYKEFNDSIAHLKSNKAAGYEYLNSNVILSIVNSIRKPLYHILHLSIRKASFLKQFGFQKNCLTEHAILDLVEQITNSFNKNNFTFGVFIDLSKAFDTVDHEILLNKIKHYGVRGKTYNWIKSYLSNRKQFVFRKDTGCLNITCGVPQG